MEELAGERELLVANAIAREMTSSALSVRQRLEDRIESEGHGLLVTRPDLEEAAGVPLLAPCRSSTRCEGTEIEILLFVPDDEQLVRGGVRQHFDRLRQQPAPRRRRQVAGDDPPRLRVPGLAVDRAPRDPREHRRRVEGVLESAMPLLSPEHRAHEGLEPEVGRVGMGQREDILGVEIAGAAERRIDLLAQERALEVGLVGDESPAGERLANGLADLDHPRPRRDALVDEPRQSAHERRDRTRGPDEARSNTDGRRPRIQEQQTDLDDLRGSTVRQTRRLEIDEGHRTDLGQPFLKRRQVEPEIPRIPPLDLEAHSVTLSRRRSESAIARPSARTRPRPEARRHERIAAPPG